MPATPLRLRAFAAGSLALVAMLTGAPSAIAAAPEYSGVQLHSLWGSVSNQEMDRELDLSRDAGANVVRVDVGWSSLETGGKGQISQWYLDKLDRFVNGAQARGIKVIAGLWSTPCWASSAPESLKQNCAGSWWDRGVTMYPPRDNADYGDIARFITARYGTKLAALEVWNEPNLPEDRFWIAADEPRAYADLLKAAYPAAKQGNSQVPVLAGSLAAADRPFLEQLYAHGIQGHYDGISFHPYNEWRDPYDRWQPQWRKYTFLPGIEWIREAQQAAGDDKPLWLTEFGWTTCSGGSWCVSDQRQADFTRRAFEILETLPYVESAVVYNLRAKGSDAGSFEDNFGLVRQDFSPKPAYEALRDALTGAEEPPAEEPPADDPPADDPPAEDPPAEDPPAENPPVEEEPPADDPPAEDAPVEDAPAEDARTEQPAESEGERREGESGEDRGDGERASRLASQRRLKLKLRKRRGTIFATGRGPRGRRVVLRLRGCAGARRSATTSVRIDGAGRFVARIGRAAAVGRCKVSARLTG